MTPEQHAQVESMFTRAAELPAPARAEFVARAATDPVVRAEVLSLLSHLDSASEFLETPLSVTRTSAGSVAGIFDIESIPAGMRIGTYTIRQFLGAGGMGVVYLAQQDRPARTVALKLIRSALASDRTRKRFEHEAEILGRLQHPGIAQIFEAGAVDLGRRRLAFIAMEFVDGPTLTDHCSLGRIPLRNRIDLMIRVCSAVHYAHQQGIIHRDLKPGNILINSQGAPKVLDFGIARAEESEPLTAATATATSRQLVGTLPYMAPEQLAGHGSGDVRTDVYALGVILYRLLVGRLPHHPSEWSVAALLRQIQSGPPAPVSIHDRVLRGDVETIVAKALDYEPSRRYESAGELAADLARYLQGEPIAARRDSALYVLNKRLRRYRGILAVSAAAVVGLAVLGVVAVAQAQRADARARDADRQQQIAIGAAGRAQMQTLRADAAAERLQRELARATIDRGRLTVQSGGLRRAEELLWPQFLATPASPSARWALWEMYMQRPIRATLVNPPRTLRRVATNRDGSLIAFTAGAELQFFDTGRSRLLASASGSRSASDLVFALDSSWVAAAFNGRVAIIDPRTGTLLHDLSLGAAEMGTLDLSSDGTLLAVTARGIPLRVFDTRTWTVRAEFPEGEGGPAAFSPEGATIAAACGATVHVFDDLGSKPRVRIISPATVRAVTWTPDAAQIGITTIDRVIRWYDARSRAQLRSLHGPSASLDQAVYTPGGRSLLLQGWWSIDAFDPQTLAPLGQYLGHTDTLTSMSLARDGSTLVSSGSDGLIRAWNLTDPHGARVLGTFPSLPINAAFSADGTRIVAFDEDCHAAILDACFPFTERRAYSVATVSPERLSDGVPVPGTPCAVLSGSRGQDASDTWLRSFDLDSHTVRWEVPIDLGEDICLAVSPDGARVLAAGRSGAIQVFEAASGTPLYRHELGNSRIMRMQFFPDGRRAIIRTASQPGTLVIDTLTGATLLAFDGSVSPWSAAVSPDGSLVALGNWNGGIEVRSATDGRILRSWDAHDQLVSAVAFSPDGTMLASGSAGGAIRLWDTASGDPLVSFEHHRGWVETLDFAPSGRLLLSASIDQSVALIDLTRYNRDVAANLELGLRLADQAKIAISPELRSSLRDWAARVLSAPPGQEPDFPTFSPHAPSPPAPDAAAAASP